MKKPLKRLATALPVFLATSFLLPPALSAREVRSSDRLALLRQATGQSTSGPASFQSRLDAIMNPTAEPQRAYVEEQDAQMLAQEQLKVGPEEEITSPVVQDQINANTLEPEKKKKAEESPRLDASEKKHAEDLENFYSEIDQQRADEIKKQEKKETEALSSGARPGTDLALENNPFYFKPKESPSTKRSFEEDKPLIESRLVQAGFTEDEARSCAREVSSPEELVIMLMRDYEYTYAQASQLVQISEGGTSSEF